MALNQPTSGPLHLKTIIKYKKNKYIKNQKKTSSFTHLNKFKNLKPQTLFFCKFGLGLTREEYAQQSRICISKKFLSKQI